MIARESVSIADKKIQEIEDLARILDRLRAEGKSTVHCHGVFDLLHIGHIRHLEHAKKYGDILIVTLTADVHVNKGPDRPVFGQDLRAEAIAALGCVDYVAINRWPMAVEIIQLLKPHFYVKGVEYGDAEKDHSGGITLEEQAVRSVGGELVFTDDITFSSSHLINRHLAVFPPGAKEYLSDFSGRYEIDRVLGYLDAVRTLKVLVVGEAIIDEYQYCQTIGKSGKEPILAARYLSHETFAGGILAVANHVASFSDEVGLLSFLGANDSHEGFIRDNLDPNIQMSFMYAENAPTIVKRRFVEAYPFQKLFELYVMGDGLDTPASAEGLCENLKLMLPNFDLVIVTDFGHGMLGPEAVEVLCEHSTFLAINTQLNADNHGFHTVSKYRRADYICVSENEIRLEVRNRRKNLRSIILDVADRLSCDRIMITRGSSGALCFSREEGFFEIPALASRVVDRVGAGDAVLAVTSLCVAKNAPMEVVGLIGNAVGGQAVGCVGNQRRIERVSLYKFLQSALK